VADGWCWFVLREEYCWLVAGGWFVLREKYCWLISQANRALFFLLVELKEYSWQIFANAMGTDILTKEASMIHVVILSKNKCKRT
jgi:hypothetical protein